MNLTHPRLLEWWTDDPADPDRMLLNDPDVQQLVAAISPESQATDLGGIKPVLPSRINPALLDSPENSFPGGLQTSNDID